LYREIRDWSLREKDVALSDWVLSQPPRGFSEFNVLAGYAHTHHPDAFEWVPVDTLSPNDRRCEWFWSWGGLDAELRLQIDHLLQPEINQGYG
jgi:hypothetical protein